METVQDLTTEETNILLWKKLQIAVEAMQYAFNNIRIAEKKNDILNTLSQAIVSMNELELPRQLHISSMLEESIKIGSVVWKDVSDAAEHIRRKRDR